MSLRGPGQTRMLTTAMHSTMFAIGGVRAPAGPCWSGRNTRDIALSHAVAHVTPGVKNGQLRSHFGSKYN